MHKLSYHSDSSLFLFQSKLWMPVGNPRYVTVLGYFCTSNTIHFLKSLSLLLFLPKRTFESTPGWPAIYIDGEKMRFLLDTSGPRPDYYFEFVAPVEDIVDDLFRAVRDIQFHIEIGDPYFKFLAFPGFIRRLTAHWSFFKRKVILLFLNY